MAYGLLAAGQSYRQQANAGQGAAAQLEEQRNSTNKQMQAAETQQRVGSTVSGAVIGAEMGASLGPYGALIGAGVGLLSSVIF